jgi:iron-sulfur cluster insertion protein
MAETATEAPTVGMSAACARRVKELVAAENDPAMMLRVAVGGGGCSGFQYSFTLDDATNADDRIVERDGARLVIDEVSWPFLAGAEIHYAEELVGSYFTVKNPNATSTCGCGTSFAVG